MPENRRTPQNTTEHRKTPQNTAEHRRTLLKRPQDTPQNNLGFVSEVGYTIIVESTESTLIHNTNN